MTITNDELTSFHEYVTKKMNNGGANLTLEECLLQWRAERERAETIAAVQLADMEAGRYYSLDEVDQSIRKEFGFKQR
jgi:hypothetical protein